MFLNTKNLLLKTGSQQFEGILITGGPGSGKTTLINALNTNGFAVHEEVARRVIKEQMALGTDAVPWDNIHSFSEIAKEVMLNEFPEAKTGIHLFDRGIPDLIGYLRLAKKVVPQDLYKALEDLNYSERAFILPPWENIYGVDNERKESFEESVKVYEALKSTYIDLGFTLIEIGKGEIEKRMEEVLISLKTD